MKQHRRKRTVILPALTLGVVAVSLMTAGIVVAQARSTQGTTVAVVEKEMRIALQPAVVNHGQVTFVVKNTGTIEHEMVVIRGASRLTVKNFEAVEQQSPGEVEGVKPGMAKKLTLKLSPGKYLLICNIPGHYMLGMHALLTVR